MRRLILATALALTLPATAAIAQTEGYTNAHPGALAGRSPHHAYRPNNTAVSCPATMHSLPGGKLPVYGATTLPRFGCDDATRVVASGSSAVKAAR